MNTLIMGSYTDVKNLIISNIKANGQREITGPILQDVLLNMLENSSRVEEITYSDLKALRDGAKLTPSRLYRITDYITTTVQSNTKSARHPFDVIVLAISESELLERAWAIQHEGDEYFANSDLNAWQIWYCLDNDTTRFAWADEINGKGVIYRMIDEWNNDVPYDFKNIIYVFKTSFTYNQWGRNFKFNRDTSIDMNIDGTQYYGYISEDTPPAWSENKCWIKEEQPTINSKLYKRDGSVMSYGGSSILNINLDNYETYTFGRDDDFTIIGNCYNNIILQYYNSGKQTLNKNIFGSSCYKNIFGIGCILNTFKNNCHNNTFGDNCSYNTFGSDCSNNVFKNDCTNNVFIDYCVANTFSYNCNYNIMGTNCHENIFGNNCYRNTFGGGCSQNIFGNDCYQNTFHSSTSYNTFGNNCGLNTFDSVCQLNTFKNYCKENYLGEWSYYNTFENNCVGIKFASDKDAATKYSYYQNNHFGNGCQYIVFTGAETASASAQVQNYKFAQGLQGTSDEYLAIDGKRNRSYETYISRDTDGTIKESVIADKLDKIIETTYANLVSLRDSSNLIPGQQYRITDYQCTTSQANTRSAGHVFDIIVTADDESTLNEVARAIKHDGDTYFANSNLSAWKLWYCLDNDFSRFGWAMIGELIDTIKPTNGNASGTYTYNVPISKIVFDNKIYNLEIGVKTTINSGPPTYVTKTDEYTLVVEDKYNFVNSGGGISVYAVSQICQGVIYRMIDEFNNDCPYDFKNIQFKHPNDTTAYPYYYYTFASFGAEYNYDCSLGKYCYSNIIKECINKNKRILNNIIFIGDQCYCNYFEKDCYNNTFDHQCSYNYLGYNCYNNTFKYGSNYNTLGIRCFNNTIHNDNNSFGNYCYNNTIRGSNNLLGKSCNINTINGDVNSLSDSCDNNVINGNNNSFGNSCKHIKFESNYYKNNHFEDNCQYILFKGAETASSSAQVQNYNFTRGLQGSSDAYLTIDGVRNLSYEAKVAKNSNDEIKIYCEADLIK